jgi:hypothetical protein
MKLKITCECGIEEIIEKHEINDWKCKVCKKETNFSVKTIIPKPDVVRYKLYANTEKESSWDAFEEAMKKAGIEVSWQDDGEASYVGSEVELNIFYDIKKKKFDVESIEYDGIKYYQSPD